MQDHKLENILLNKKKFCNNYNEGGHEMDGLIINDTNLGFKTINGKRVVTFKEIDMVHGRPDGTARDRFNDHKSRFILGEDYYIVKPADLENTELGEIHSIENDKSKLIVQGIDMVSPRGTVFLTETGYLMIAKVFTDDLAWDVQRRLVDTYFKTQELSLTVKDVLALKDELMGMVQRTMALEEKHAQLSEDVTHVRAAVEDIHEGKVKKSKWISDKKVELGKRIEHLCHNHRRDGREYTKEEMTEEIIRHMADEGIDFDRFVEEYKRRYNKIDEPYRLDVIFADGDLISAFEAALDRIDMGLTPDANDDWDRMTEVFGAPEPDYDYDGSLSPIQRLSDGSVI